MTVTGGIEPTIAATRRQDNGPPNVLEVFIAGQLAPGETTSFTFDTGTGPQQISYTLIRPDIPACSTWGLLVLGLSSLLVGTLLFRKRAYA